MALRNRLFVGIFLSVSLLSACGIYTFSGTSIPENVKTFSVDFFENKASIVAPNLSQTFTEKLKDKFTSETNLLIEEEAGDFDFSGYISNYTVTPVSARNNETAQLNRLKIKVHVILECVKDPKLSFETDFENFQDFDATTDLSTIEGQLIDEITDMLVQNIFNKAAINW